MPGDDKFNSEEFKALLVAGDFVAWDEVFLSIRSRLIGYIVCLMGEGARCQPEAEELSQDISFNILKSFSKGRSHYRGDCDPVSYIFTIARNAVINRNKKKDRERAVIINEDRQGDGSNDATKEPADPRPNLEEKYEDKEFLESIKFLLKALPPIYREPLKLSFIDELEKSEIARILQISKGLVSVRIHRAEKMFRRLTIPFLNKKRWQWRGIFVSDDLHGCVVKRVLDAVTRISISANDHIIGVEDNPIHSVEEFAKRTNEVEASKDVRLIIIRGKERNEEMEVIVPGAKN